MLSSGSNTFAARSNPAEVKEGPYKGLKVLADEEDKARKFVRSLSPPQRNMAILSDKAPRDILTGQDSVIDRKTFFSDNCKGS